MYGSYFKKLQSGRHHEMKRDNNFAILGPLFNIFSTLDDFSQQIWQSGYIYLQGKDRFKDTDKDRDRDKEIFM